MNFEEAWAYLQGRQCLALQTEDGRRFTARVTGRSVVYESTWDQTRHQSKENLAIYFEKWSAEGCRERSSFRNFGPRQSRSARARYFLPLFRYLASELSKGQEQGSQQSVPEVSSHTRVQRDSVAALVQGSDEVLSQDQLTDLRDALVSAQPHDPADDLTRLVPKRIGVYIWSAREDDSIVYVGKAVGCRGLYTRIIKQHLNPRYLLTDQTKWHREKDAYQAAEHALLNGKPAIDKSAFRKNIGRMHRLPPGQPTVDFIRSHFLLRFVLVPSKAAGAQLEHRIISAASPRYNIAGK